MSVTFFTDLLTGLDWAMVLGGLFVGFVVGLTGMGGGALMTPMLVFFFNVPPLAAVSSDLVAAAVMKPVGGYVHMRHGTVHWGLVRWLMVGSVPAAFCGVLLLSWLGDGEDVQLVVKKALGVALILAATSLIVKAYISMVERARRRRGEAGRVVQPVDQVRVKPLPTVLIGAAGGLVVGMTSVGSGSMIIIALMAVYPGLSAAALVGTDLIQAVPLVGSAALGHLLFGDFQMTITTSLLLGSVPGVYMGAKVSSQAPSGIVRRALGLVLLASGLKLLEAPTVATVTVLLSVILLGPPLWALARRRQGLVRRSIAQDLLPWLWNGDPVVGPVPQRAKVGVEPGNDRDA
jgi:uncharacterized membrane protein YfcA